jgi:hypothetical protein
MNRIVGYVLVDLLVCLRTYVLLQSVLDHHQLLEVEVLSFEMGHELVLVAYLKIGFVKFENC